LEKEQNRSTALALVVQRMNNTIHWINNQYQVDSVVCFVDTYPLDSDLSGGLLMPGITMGLNSLYHLSRFT